MNKYYKIIISILGATNIIFDIFIPIALSLLLVNTIDLNWYTRMLLITAGIFSSMYKAIVVADLDNLNYILKNKR